MKKIIKPLILGLALTTGTAIAADNNTTDNHVIRTTLTNAGLTAPIQSIVASPISSLTLLTLGNGQEPLLITDDLQYIIQGNIEPNPSKILDISKQISTAAAGTPISNAHKTALLSNMTALKNIDDDAAFYHTNIKDVLWGVSASGTPFLVSADGQYFINGEISVIKEGRFAGLDNDFETAKNRHVFSKLDEDTLTIYPAKGQQRAVVYIATDINCPYCRMFHHKIHEFNTKGITVKAIGYPVYDESHTPMRQIWCETNNTKRAALLSAAMKGIHGISNACQNDKNPIKHNQIMAHSLAVIATPAIFNEHGDLFQGDFTTDEFLEFLNIK